MAANLSSGLGGIVFFSGVGSIFTGSVAERSVLEATVAMHILGVTCTYYTLCILYNA